MADPLPHAHREEIRALAAAVSPPWTIEVTDGRYRYVCDVRGNIVAAVPGDAAELIVGSFAAVPELVAELDRVERELLRTRVQLVMARANTTVEQIAVHYGYNLGRLAAAVEGRAGFTPLHLAEIGDFTGVTVDWLLNGDNEPVQLPESHQELQR